MMERCRACSTVALATLLLVAADPARTAEDPPGRHNMLVVGQQSVFLSHLPMFEGVNGAGTDYVSRHRYQVILEAGFGQNGDATGVYLQDRRAHLDARMYTLKPELFVLSRLFTPPEQPALASIKRLCSAGIWSAAASR
jgi:hypothetical protein